MTLEPVKLPVADGTVMVAYTAAPSGAGPFPGLLLFQEAFGANHHIRGLAERFAAEGFLTIAPELFHRTAPTGFEGSYTDFATVAPHMQALTENGLGDDVRAAAQWLERHPKIRPGALGAIGYCLGGRVSFLANALLPLKAAVSYYGGRMVPDLVKRAPALSGPMLFFWGGRDQHIPAEQINAVLAALRQAAKPYTNVVISDANHGFFCDERASYNAAAAHDAWALTLAFLRRNLASPRA
jgi:carboxymethylenebutenolidase